RPFGQVECLALGLADQRARVGSRHAYAAEFLARRSSVDQPQRDEMAMEIDVHRIWRVQGTGLPDRIFNHLIESITWSAAPQPMGPIGIGYRRYPPRIGKRRRRRPRQPTHVGDRAETNLVLSAVSTAGWLV